MRKFLHYHSDYDTLLHINGKDPVIVPKGNMLDIISSEKLYVTIESPSMLPQSMILDCGGDNICNNDCMSCIPYLNHHYDLCYNPIPYCNDNCQNVLYTLLLAKLYLLILGNNNGNNHLQIFDNNKLKYNARICDFDDIDCTLVGKKLLIIAKHGDTYDFKCIDTGDYTTESFSCDKISIGSDKLTCITYLNDPVGLGEVRIYNLSDGTHSKYPIYRNGTAYEIDDDRILGYAMLSCIKASNIVHAKKYLSDNLSSCKDSSLVNYFKEIKEIYPDPYTSDNDNYYYTVKNNAGYTKYSFKIKNHKIVDIDQIT